MCLFLLLFLNVLNYCSEWLLFNAKWAIIQLHVYHGENKLHVYHGENKLHVYHGENKLHAYHGENKLHVYHGENKLPY